MIDNLIIELDYKNKCLINHLSHIGVIWRNLDPLNISPPLELSYKCYFTFNTHGFDRFFRNRENCIYLDTKYALLFFKECKSEHDINLILTTFINVIKPISDKLIIDLLRQLK